MFCFVFICVAFKQILGKILGNVLLILHPKTTMTPDYLTNPNLTNVNLESFHNRNQIFLHLGTYPYYTLEIIFYIFLDLRSIYLLLSSIQYCEKVMRAKCANFVLCPGELSTKFRSKIRASFRDVPSVISLKQREKIRRIFEPSAKVRSKNKERKFAAFSRPARKFALKTKGENSPHFRDHREKPKAYFCLLYRNFVVWFVKIDHISIGYSVL